MHPIVQLTVAVLLMVIAARMWPPLLYIAAAITVVLLLTKCIRRAVRWARGSYSANSLVNVSGVAVCIIVAYIVSGSIDYLASPKLSAVTIVNCFVGAIVGTAALVWIFEAGIALVKRWIAAIIRFAR